MLLEEEPIFENQLVNSMLWMKKREIVVRSVLGIQQMAQMNVHNNSHVILFLQIMQQLRNVTLQDVKMRDEHELIIVHVNMVRDEMEKIYEYH